ncbi:class I SAM-dependent methyltransferase [Lentibacillus daqui]|uniref:class I SAM-dependent methyltransferase n=1 Tax=Lentibacillus daqui TaxID=2911514 RepID=UPI0022B150F1|nr:class I SAM-dependent methyltransferase [Lentibacillus daqui]
MGIDFHNEKNKHSYVTRKVDDTWLSAITALIQGRAINKAVDIGTGGGIYAKALADLGIPSITGIDFSEVMLDGAEQYCRLYEQIEFKLGNAYSTGLSSAYADLVLERALIHHLDNLAACFSEVYRILQPEGMLLVQDRTPEDCLIQGDHHHIRGYLFSLFPHLGEIETKRRYASHTVKAALGNAGFHAIKEIKLWEVRKTYTNKEELLNDIKSRNGRSILHELSDQQVSQFADHVNQLIQEDGLIVEKDRWTIWAAEK